MRGLFLAGAMVLVLAAAFPAFAEAPDDLGRWHIVVSDLSQWHKAPDLPAESEVSCHFHGAGKFRVIFRQGQATQRYTVDLPDALWLRFSRTLNAGPTEVMVEPVADPRYAAPSLKAFVATTNADFAPSVDDFDHPLYLIARNLGAADARVELTVATGKVPSCAYLHYLSADGFSPTSVLKAGATTRTLNLSRVLSNRSVLTFNPATDRETDVEVRLYADSDATREIKTLRLKGNPAPNDSVIASLRPGEALRLVTIAELINGDLETLRTALKDDPRPVPIRSFVSCNVLDLGEALATYRSELDLVRLVGADAARALGRLEKERKERGFNRYWDMAPGFLPWRPDWFFNPEVAKTYAQNTFAQNPQEDGVIMCWDETGYYELTKGPELDARFRKWMEEAKLTPTDAGVTDWPNVHCIAPDPRAPKLSVLSWKFQLREQIRYWNGYALALTAVDPKIVPVVNWGVSVYYDGSPMDLWELYRQPGLDAVWAEDWSGYETFGTGIIAWYADLMRSQAKYRNLPMGAYPILGYENNPSHEAMRFYERFMRGCHYFELYTYQPRGNEPTWLETQAAFINIARRLRDLAQVEDILVDGKVLDARAAILYPNSAQLWNIGVVRDAIAFYLATIQSGIPLDIVTEQDLVDGLAKDYKALIAFGPNIRPDALAALRAFAEAGGTVACVGAPHLSPTNEPIPEANAFLSVKSVECTSNDEPGRFQYGLWWAKQLDTVRWNGTETPVYCRKWKVEPAGAETLAQFSDGRPAIIRSSCGKGIVIFYAFSPGLSYMHADFGIQLKPDYGTLLDPYGIPLCNKTVERKLCTLPTANVGTLVSVNAEMISHRVVASDGGAVVGLIDYGVGELGRQMKDLSDLKKVNFETMKPFLVKVAISCKTRPDKVLGVRCGAVTWDYSNGQLTVEVPLRGVDMLVLKGRALF